MAEVIAFPQRVETKTFHFDEKHAFGEIGGLMLSLVQEQGHADGHIMLVLLGGVDGFLPLRSFAPSPEGFEAARAAGEMALEILAAGHTNWTE
ncbi:hypothetical protein [Microvirga zambiensis]|uniref:hypothetical protein n=1 Tax=Microvirga zambiensis TaxID=1402137 RepID=UPI00191FA591|nr:hypothetical protein [Microvirga zambiensis]